jgi:hypothetical protein
VLPNAARWSPERRLQSSAKWMEHVKTFDFPNEQGQRSIHTGKACRVFPTSIKS